MCSHRLMRHQGLLHQLVFFSLILFLFILVGAEAEVVVLSDPGTRCA